MVMEDGFATFLSSVEKELSPPLLTAQTTKALKFYRNYCKRKQSTLLFVSAKERPIEEGDDYEERIKA